MQDLKEETCHRLSSFILHLFVHSIFMGRNFHAAGGVRFSQEMSSIVRRAPLFLVKLLTLVGVGLEKGGGGGCNTEETQICGGDFIIKIPEGNLELPSVFSVS